MSELQPFVDNRDPLYVRVGNPDLIPEYTHGLSASYRYFDQFSFVPLFTYLKATSTVDDIVPSRTVDDQGRQVVTSVNAGRGWSTNGGVYFGTPIRAIGARLEVSYRGMYSKDSEFVSQTYLNRLQPIMPATGRRPGCRTRRSPGYCAWPGRRRANARWPRSEHRTG